jgi:hypothetical protein
MPFIHRRTSFFLHFGAAFLMDSIDDRRASLFVFLDAVLGKRKGAEPPAIDGGEVAESEAPQAKKGKSGSIRGKQRRLAAADVAVQVL